MKKIALLLVLFGLLFISAAEQPSSGIGQEDVEKIEGAIEKIPLDKDTGKVNFDDNDIKTRADERIAQINNYVGPFTKFFFGTELSLSWIFIFSFVLWILLIEILIEPTSQIFDWNFWWSLIGSTCIASLAMHGFGNDFVIWINSIVTAWYIGLITLVFAAFFYVLYHVIMTYLGAQVKGMREASEMEKDVKHSRLRDAEDYLIERRLRTRWVF